jgi:hypothetical protein
MDPYGRSEWKGFNGYKSLWRVLRYFSAREALKFMGPQSPPVGPRHGTFHCLLAISDWQSIIEDLERDMRRLQSQATQSLEKTTLEAMGLFRRRLAATRESIADNDLHSLLATGTTTVRNIRHVSTQRPLSPRTHSLFTHDRSPVAVLR